jgi:hypothetical protein
MSIPHFIFLAAFPAKATRQTDDDQSPGIMPGWSALSIIIWYGGIGGELFFIFDNIAREYSILVVIVDSECFPSQGI